MSWRIRIKHRSRYDYTTEVTSSYNEVRMTPLTTPSQLVLDSDLTVQPMVRPFRYWDYWGAVVHAFDLHLPHTSMEIIGTSVVETAMPQPMGTGVGWDDLNSEPVRDRFAELLAPTAYVPSDPRLQEVAAELARNQPPADAAIQAVAWVRNTLTYVAGTTGVHTSAVEAWDGGRGVCQDFAHLTLGLIRSMGIPGRYCSGYQHPNPDAGIGTVLDGQSHAWIEYWTGDWHGVDPTIGWPVGERHVLVARGRDYGDVAPLKGIYHGGQAAGLSVSVELTRLG